MSKTVQCTTYSHKEFLSTQDTSSASPISNIVNVNTLAVITRHNNNGLSDVSKHATTISTFQFNVSCIALAYITFKVCLYNL